MRRTFALAWVAALALGCRDEPGATAISTTESVATSSPVPAPSPSPTPSGPSPPSPAAGEAAIAPRGAILSRAVVVEPAGSSPLPPGSETVVDPASTFQVELSGRIEDARLVLLDAANAHVPARSTHEVGGKTQLALVPAAPLVAGSRYVLRVEGETTRELRDGDRAWAPLSFPLLTAGTPPPPEPKKKATAKKRRRR